MQNNDRSLESMDKEQETLKNAIQILIDEEQEVPEELLAKHRELFMAYHPDHWFMDPGSGRETEDGRRRRRALQACWADCPMKARLLCLDRGLQEGPTLQYGIYGGYTEKQRQAIVEERTAHEARQAK